MVTFENLSRNLAIVLNEIIANQNICKYLSYNHDDPIAQLDISLPATSMLRTHVLPYPFDLDANDEDKSQVRVYYPKAKMDKGFVTGDVYVNFDVVVSKKLWLLSNEQESGIRPYSILNEIIKQFNDVSIDTVGKITFKEGFAHIYGNAKFDIVRLVGVMFTTK